MPLLLISLGAALLIPAARSRHRSQRGRVVLLALGGVALVVLGALPVLDMATGYTVLSMR